MLQIRNEDKKIERLNNGKTKKAFIINNLRLSIIEREINHENYIERRIK